MRLGVSFGNGIVKSKIFMYSFTVRPQYGTVPYLFYRYLPNVNFTFVCKTQERKF
jgi:hypothetical protein